jgi:hypothetical protein
MASNLGAEILLTNHDIFELDESNEDNMEEEVEANNKNVLNYFHSICIFFFFYEYTFMSLPLLV